MKQSDIAVVILITSLSLVLAYWLGGMVINTPEHRGATVEIAIPINIDFPEPSAKIFNDSAINPTEKIIIGDANKLKPFEDSN